MSTSDPRSSRHRPSERFAPRPGDLISDRLRALAAWAHKANASTEVEGTHLDATTLEAMAEAQARAEQELVGSFGTLKRVYTTFEEARRVRKRLLEEAIRHFAARHQDAEARTVLRLCRLRRPPLAKVHAACGVAAARDVG